jgi:hypothetical protein
MSRLLIVHLNGATTLSTTLSIIKFRIATSRITTLNVSTLNVTTLTVTTLNITTPSITAFSIILNNYTQHNNGRIMILDAECCYD